MTTTAHELVTTIDYFESIYADAHGDPGRIPWADGRASPALVTWLNVVAPSMIRCGARVAAPGCGLGDDARELIRRGYDVCAFDCSETAVRWAQSLDAENVQCYAQADVYNPPARWRHRFDLVVEVNNLESLTPDLHERTIAAQANLMSPHGRLLVICRGADQPVGLHEGPPWPMTEAELVAAAARAGLVPDGEVCCFPDDEDPPVQRIRAVLRRV
ncbi:MAG: class I SAM-dependent methyltransferase [Planctomycetota bacterium]|jgi:2-polyprenyl-3-methyl-5-hydroxy-6-metoxy-1,4-benzoquinol methylase